MSIEIEIRVCLSREARENKISALEQVLFAVQQRIPWNEPVPPLATKWFDSIEVCEKDIIHPEFKQDVNTKDPAEVIDVVRKHLKPNCAIRVNSGFEYLTTDIKTNKPDYGYRPLSITLFDPEFYHGYKQKHYGDISLSFYSRHTFSLSKEVVQSLRSRVDSRLMYKDGRQVLNIYVVNNISRNIINRLNPIHLVQ